MEDKIFQFLKPKNNGLTTIVDLSNLKAKSYRPKSSKSGSTIRLKSEFDGSDNYFTNKPKPPKTRVIYRNVSGANPDVNTPVNPDKIIPIQSAYQNFFKDFMIKKADTQPSINQQNSLKKDTKEQNSKQILFSHQDNLSSDPKPVSNPKCFIQPETKKEVEDQKIEVEDQKIEEEEDKKIEDKNPIQIDYCFKQDKVLDEYVIQNLMECDFENLISDEILTSNKIDLNKILDDNMDYFYHLSGQCACKKCTCCMCKCNFTNIKIKHSSGFKTTYTDDFYSKKRIGKIPLINEMMYKTNHQQTQQIGKYETLKTDYQEHKIVQKSQRKLLYFKNQTKLNDSTQYINNFRNWQQSEMYHVKAPVHISTSSAIPFFGGTTYQESFSQSKQDNRQPRAHAVDQGVMPKPSWFFGETTSGTYNKKNLQQIVSWKVPEEFHHIDNFQGQLTTIKQKDYQNLKFKNCALKTEKKHEKKIMRDILLYKLNEVKKKKLQAMVQKL